MATTSPAGEALREVNVQRIVPALSIPEVLPLSIPPLTERGQLTSRDGKEGFEWSLPKGWEHLPVPGDAEKIVYRESGGDSRVLEIDFLGEIKGDSGNESMTGPEAVKFARKIFKCCVTDMHGNSSEEITCVGNTPDAAVPGTPRSNNLRAILCGVVVLGTAEGRQTMQEEQWMREDMGEDSDGEADHAGEEMRSNLTLAIAEVNGATVLITLTRLSYEPYMSTPRALGRYLSSTWRWVRGHKEPIPPLDPNIEGDVDIVRSIVGAFRWTGSARGDPPVSDSGEKKPDVPHETEAKMQVNRAPFEA
jgi:hypothetical protein